jgi:DNA (cytosine-5)-methyltransferase 1
MVNAPPAFLEFFAGGGLARQGLEGLFSPNFANDIDPAKCAGYRLNFPGTPLHEGDIWNLRPGDLPPAALAWASFPCQDLSLAGARRGLNAPRSGAFWGFWNLLEGLAELERAPATLALENVPGLLSSHGGRDFSSLIATLAEGGYRVGAVMADAALFSPQSRQRLFIIAHRGRLPQGLVRGDADPVFHPQALRSTVEALPMDLRLAWTWWRLPHPPARNTDLASLLERSPPEDVWRSYAAVRKLMGQMSPLHRARVDAALADGSWKAGAVFRRTRTENGRRIQRAEVRYDGLAGCLRTPAGGSSKQLLIVTEGGEARLRPLLAVEAARLMGCSGDYTLPKGETAALKMLGDGVCVPVVRWIGEHLLHPLATGRSGREVGAAA